MSIARHDGGIEMLKPSDVRATVVHPAASALFVGDGEGVGAGVGVGEGETEAAGDEQAVANPKARIRSERRNTSRMLGPGLTGLVTDQYPSAIPILVPSTPPLRSCPSTWIAPGRAKFVAITSSTLISMS